MWSFNFEIKVNYMNVMRVLAVIGLLGFVTTGLAAQNKVQVSALQGKPKQNTLYKIELKLERALEKDAELEVDFPKAFNLSTVQVVGSNTVNGGFSHEITDSSIKIKRSGLGDSVPAGTTAEIFFGPIRNPELIPEIPSVKTVLSEKNKTDLQIQASLIIK